MLCVHFRSLSSSKPRSECPCSLDDIFLAKENSQVLQGKELNGWEKCAVMKKQVINIIFRNVVGAAINCDLK